MSVGTPMLTEGVIWSFHPRCLLGLFLLLAAAAALLGCLVRVLLLTRTR